MAKKKSSRSDASRSMQSNKLAASVPSGQAYAVPAVVGPEGELLKHRVRTVSDIQSAFMQIWSADQASDYNRAIQQAFIDGVPPFTDTDGTGMGRVNVNWGFGRKLMEQFELPYTDLLESSGVLFNVQTKHGDEASRAFTEPLLAQGISRMLRRWRPYNTLYQKRAQLFVREGVAICFYDDDRNWQWQVMGQQNMKFPREASTCEDDQDSCGCKVDMIASKLAQYVKNKDVAEAMGWNVGAVEEALKHAKPRSQYIQNDHQHWQAKWKDNDVLWSVTAPVIETIHWFQGETDGTVSHYIVRWDGEGEILYKSEGKYHEFSRLMTMFTYGIGTNGDLQSCRGQGSFGYQAGNAMNRIMCAGIEMGMHANTPHITVSSEDSLNDLPLRRMGPYMTVQNGTQFIETKVPDFGSSLIPLFGLTANIFQQQTQGGTALIPAQAMERMTNEQSQQKMMQEGSLTASQMTIFFSAEECHLREVVRRIIRPTYRVDEPGGKQINDLKVWLERQKVPLEALYAIDVDSLEVNTGIGRGSRMDRLNIANQLMAAQHNFDAQAQNRIKHMWVGALGNAQLANDIEPLTPGQRPGEQVQVAVNENGMLTGKNEIQIASVVILPDQDHAAHVETHIGFLQQLWPMTRSQDVQNAFLTISPLWEHATEQWERMNPESPFYKEAKQALREMSEWVTNTAKQLAAEQQREALGEGGEGQEQGGATPTQMVHSFDAEAKLGEIVHERARLDMDRAREEMKTQAEGARLAMKLQAEAQSVRLKQADRLLSLKAKLDAQREAKTKAA